MPPKTGMSFVLVQHLSPEHESMLPTLLQSSTQMPVVEATDGAPLLGDHVYVIPPNATLRVAAGHLALTRPAPARAFRRPIDTLFESLAADQGDHAVCIVLAGSGSDGTEGLKAVKEYGGLSLAQAEFDHQPLSGMPSSATQTGLVDYVLPIEGMPTRLIAYAHHLRSASRKRDTGTIAEAKHLALICRLLQDAVGHDFREYKRKTLMRRIQRRMQVLQVDSMRAYVERLRQDRAEIRLLFQDLLIGVTRFFRDPGSFDALADRVILPLLADKGSGDAVRVWVPGCATGQEAYSIAILLREAAEKAGVRPEFQVFATDIDEHAIAVARAARYPQAEAADIPAARFERWFTADGTHFAPVKQIREMCIFSTHSVIKDPPFSRLDLISCRNLLIYFDNALQDRVLRTFHYSLRPGGYLFLASSENAGRQAKLFAEIDVKNRLYQRRDAVTVVPGLGATHIAHTSIMAAAPSPSRHDRTLDDAVRTLMETQLPPFVVIDASHDVVRFSGQTERYLGPAPGTASLNLFSLLRSSLRSPARVVLSKARSTSRTARYDRVPLERDGVDQFVDLIAEPLPPYGDGNCILAFRDCTPAVAQSLPSRKGAKGSTKAIELELQETRRRLEEAIVQSETSNQELKSANEEYQSVNEELQSANEELETSKEELQSINEELQTVNAELLNKSNRLQEVNDDLRNLLDSTQIATLFLDRELRIRNFTPAMTNLLHLRESDQGRPVTDLVSRLDYDEMAADAITVQKELQVLEREVRIKDNSAWYMMRLRPYRTADNVIDGVVITCVDVTERKRAEDLRQHLMDELNHRVRNTLATVRAIVIRTLAKDVNAASVQALDARLLSLAQTHTLLANDQWSASSLRALLLQELAPFEQEGRQRFVLEGPEVAMNPAASLSLGMAFHELATNAAKYGALSNAGGQVRVTWKISPEPAPGALLLEWKETGGPTVVSTERRGFGSTVIERGVSYELHGKVEFDLAPAGLVVGINLPLDKVMPTEKSPTLVAHRAPIQGA